MSTLISTLNKGITNVTYNPTRIQRMLVFYEIAFMFMAMI